MRRLVASFVLVSGSLASVAFTSCAPAYQESGNVTPPPTASVSTTPSASQSAIVDTSPKPPVAKKIPHATTIHGVTLNDDYFWMRNKDSKEVLDYLAEERDFTAKTTESLTPLRDKLYAEMVGRLQQTDESPPVKDGAFVYYTRTLEGKQYAIHCRKPAKPKKGEKLEDVKEEILVDLNELALQNKFVSLGTKSFSDDGNVFAYTLDTTGFRQFTLHVKDQKTGKTYPETIERVDDVELAADGKILLYVTEDATTKRANKLFRHVLGEDPKNDALVYEEKDERFDLFFYKTRSKAWFVVTSASHTTTEVRLVSTKDPKAAPKLVAPRENDHEYYLDHAGDLFYVHTNSGGRNFRLMTAKTSDPSRDKWKEIVAHRDDVMLEGVEAFKDHLVLKERRDGLPRLRITDLQGKGGHEVELPEPVFTVSFDRNPEFDSHLLRFHYQSFVTPDSVFEDDVKTKARKVLKVTKVLGYDAKGYASKRIDVLARDGKTKVPVSLLYKAGTSPDGKHPLFLVGYGSYGFPYPDSFSSERLSLVDRGVVFALAHVRGGGELGKKWHDDGRMLTKAHTFTDFIDVAEALVTQGWAARDKIAANGKSAGGLLMGAIVNLRPDLFRVVIADVPFVDVINTMLDETLPLTVGEFEEWGNPKKKAEYDVMMSYSPYDNVAAKPYPTMLVKTSYNDSQVMYWEPTKWVAKLRAMKTDKNPLVLQINMDPAGHGGLSGRYDHLKEVAFDESFALHALGIDE